MNLQETMEKLQLSESSLKSNFSRTQKVLLKKGIILKREGRGGSANFIISYTSDYIDYENIYEYQEYPKMLLNNCNDLRKNKYGKLKPLYRTSKGVDANRYPYWVCKCDCGKITAVDARNLISGRTKSCGCFNQEQRSKRAFKDLTNQIFGELRVIKRAYPIGEEHGDISWLCKCSCGEQKIIKGNALKNGRTISCGHIGRSKGEFKIYKILSSNNILFEQERTFEDCFFSTNRKARFDFYLPDYNCCIEFDGKQHFQYDDKNSWNIKEYFEQNKIRDKFKNDYCKKKNIILIRIPYTHYDNLCLNDLLPKTSKFII